MVDTAEAMRVPSRPWSGQKHGEFAAPPQAVARGGNAAAMDLYKIAAHGEANAMSRFGVWRGRLSLKEKPEHAWQDFAAIPMPESRMRTLAYSSCRSTVSLMRSDAPGAPRDVKLSDILISCRTGSILTCLGTAARCGSSLNLRLSPPLASVAFVAITEATTASSLCRALADRTNALRVVPLSKSLSTLPLGFPNSRWGRLRQPPSDRFLS
jgi:hypothetical protein